MTENEIRALKIDVENGLYTINEALEKLGEPKVTDPEADQLMTFDKETGWHLLDNAPVRARIAALLPKAFSRLRTAGGEPRHHS
jgi:hypothetical protein